MVTIRELIPADAAALNALTKDALRRYPTSFTTDYAAIQDRPDRQVVEHLLELQKSQGYRLGAFDPGGQLISTLRVSPRPGRKQKHCAELMVMFVVPEWQNQGVGRRMLETVIERSSENSALQQLELVVSCDARTARNLYEKVGFVVTGTIRNRIQVNGKFCDCSLMWRPLERR